MLARWTRTSLALLLASTIFTGTAHASSGLEGSRASMKRQNRIAKQHDYTFLRSPKQVRQFVGSGTLVATTGNANYRTAKVSFPYARPEVRTLVERLAGQYREATGEMLVVTSLTRPKARQPANAHPLSVHPAGMAVDLRVPADPEGRRWLESTLLSLEAKGVLDVTRERRPPHYHVAVFPGEYRAYVARLEARDTKRRESGDRVAGTSSAVGPVAASVANPEGTAATGSPDGGPAGPRGEGSIQRYLALLSMPVILLTVPVPARRTAVTCREV